MKIITVAWLLNALIWLGGIAPARFSGYENRWLFFDALIIGVLCLYVAGCKEFDSK